MDVRQLEYFLAVVDRGGFNRAASALYVSQPSLSQAVRALERDLGAELFHRIGRRVVLTEAGRALIDPAREAVRSLETARASVACVRELRSGRLDIAAMPSQAVEPLTTLIRSCTERYPGVAVAVRAAFTVRGVIDAVRTGAVELGLLASGGAVPDKEVRSHVLGEQRFVLVVPPGGPFAGRERVSCEELAGQRLIVGQPGTGMRASVAGDVRRRCATLPRDSEMRALSEVVLGEAERRLSARPQATVACVQHLARLVRALYERLDRLEAAAQSGSAPAPP